VQLVQVRVAQVEAGAPVDVIATADPEAMARLVRAGLVDAPRTFARNRLAIAVEPGNPERIAGLADLARSGLKVVLADPSVPAGRYARQALERAGAAVRPVSLELDVKAVARKVETGEADAGIVYADKPYVISIFSKNLKDQEAGDRAMVEISRTVWNALGNREDA